ncbi:DNA-binding transcriptional regulator, LysR family [Methylobacterium phyllostachyos]|uniref:DNA-binding transcriptional regulator, LysR family n=1 Tax=Methylobacterium phyllostachyos TaxID=582672 RepID=A0A1H0J2W3_9HYPH|nr:LysR family transcriptional regulator [Methylobacterium phyllostachyos]SDO37932.1 DNA-binding transcriptional regulator, LysR family [Methylobacterium phyllostachyos]
MARIGPNWDDLRYFLAVARTGTLSAAAARLGTEHTTVGRRIRALEEGLGGRLFHRSNLGYALTEDGANLLGVAEAMESAFLSAIAATGAAQTVSGTVRIGAPDGFGSVFLAPRMHRLTARHPGLEVEIMATARIFSLSKREADIVISLSGPQQARVVARRLTDYRLFVYAAESYCAAAAPITEVADLSAHSFVGYIEDMLFTRELNYLGALGPPVSARLRSTNLLAQVYATRAGAGLCVLPAFIAAAHPGLVPVLPDRVSLTRAFHMHIHEDHRKAAHIRAVASFIAAEVEAAGALFAGPAVSAPAVSPDPVAP